MMHETCDKHDATMDRLFTSINSIVTEQKIMSTQMATLIKFGEDMHAIVYGNGQEGLISKVRRALFQINWLWALLILVLGAIIGYGVSTTFGRV